VITVVAVGDVHGDYQALARIGEAERGALALLQIGDLIARPADAAGMALLRALPLPLVWVTGNHEDWVALDDPAVRPGRLLAAGELWESAGLRMAGVGGTHAPTWYRRDKPFPGERRRHYNYQEIEATAALGPGGVDILMAHEAPHGLVRLAGGRDPGQVPLDQLLREAQPRVFLSGHHHRWSQAQLGLVTAFSLPLAAEGYLRLRWETVGQRVKLLGWDHVVTPPMV